MKDFFSRKKIAILATAGAVVLGSGVAAFAYFSASGSGTGSATITVGSPGTVTITQDAYGASAPKFTAVTLYPGSGSQSVGFTVTNNGVGHQYVGTVTATVNSSGGNVTSGGTPVVGCLASWFTVTGAAVPVNTDLAGAGTIDVGNATTVPSTIAVSMTNAAASQNSCAGKSIDLAFTSS